MRDGLLLEHDKFSRDEIDCALQVFATLLQLTLHLATACQVVADDGLVIGVEGVGILGLHHDLIGFEEALHARVPFRLLLCTQLFDRLFIQAGQQAHQLFIALNSLLVVRTRA